MAERRKPGDASEILAELRGLLENFESHLLRDDLRQQVLHLVPALNMFRNLGCSLIDVNGGSSARERILAYFKKYVGVVISSEELMVVSGISEYARRIRELRVQHGWPIISGVTLQNMEADGQTDRSDTELPKLKPDEYILVSSRQDTEAAFRWNIANDIRKEKNTSVRDRILKYFRTFVGRQISGEELRYVAGDKTEWARRTRELRTEFGWPVMTRFTGRPDLPIGVYVLEEDRQAPEHDRKIPASVSGAVLARDNYTCQDCGWTHEKWNRSDPRHLEAHHLKHHADGGTNTEDNLITLCNICHDVRHSGK